MLKASLFGLVLGLKKKNRHDMNKIAFLANDEHILNFCFPLTENVCESNSFAF